MKVYLTHKIVKRDKVIANPDVLYLFGDNDARVGLGGQAKEMRGELNTLGISTKKAPNNHPWAFKTDKEFVENVRIILEDCEQVINYVLSGQFKAIVIPPIGIGLAKLPEKAPKTFEVLQMQLKLIAKIAETVQHET